MLKKNQYTPIFILLMILASSVYITGLFTGVTGDAGKYAAIAKGIYESGDFINLKIHNEPYLQKPPLLFWLSSLGFYLFGVSEFAYKLFPTLLSVLGVYSTYKLGSLLYNVKTGRLAGIILFTSEIFMLYNTDLHTDLLLMIFTTFALWHLFAYLKFKRISNYILGFCGIGLAMMSKGPIGAFVPGMAILFQLLFTKDYKTLFNSKWIPGLLIILLIISPALLGLYNQFGIKGLSFYFWTNNIGRVSGSYVGSNTDYLFYLHTLLYIFTPWSIMALISLFLQLKDFTKRSLSEFITIGGFYPFLLILSLAKAKAPHYILIAIPLLCIITAKWYLHFIEEGSQKTRSWIYGLHIITTGAILLTTINVFIIIFPTTNLIIWSSLIIFLGLIILLIIKPTLNIEKTFLSPIASIIFLNLIINTYIIPEMFKYQSPNWAAKDFNQLKDKQDTLYTYRYNQYEPFFYAENNPQLINDSILFNKICAEKNNIWIFTDQTGLDQYTNINSKSDTIIKYKHKYLTRSSLKFLYAPTRKSTLSDFYLIKK